MSEAALKKLLTRAAEEESCEEEKVPGPIEDGDRGVGVAEGGGN